MRFCEVNESDYKRMSSLITNKKDHFFVFPSASYPMTVAQIKERVEPKKEFILIEDEGELIGFANLYDDNEEQHVFIGNFVIALSYRGQGYGVKLMHHMMHIAREKYQLSEIRISLISTNKNAFSWYSKLGFTPYSVEVIDEETTFIHMKMPLY